MRAGGSVHARAHAHARAQCAMEARCVPARRGPRGAWGARCALVDGRSAPPRRYQAGRGTRRRRAKGAGMPAPLVRWSGGAHGTAQGKGAASGWVDAWGDAWVVRMRGSWAHSSGSLAFFISSRVTFISGASHGEHVRGRWRCACRANPNRARAWTRRDRSELLARRPKAVELRLGPRFQGVRRSILCHGRRGGVSSRGGEHARSDGGKNCNL